MGGPTKAIPKNSIIITLKFDSAEERDRVMESAKFKEGKDLVEMATLQVGGKYESYSRKVT